MSEVSAPDVMVEDQKLYMRQMVRVKLRLEEARHLLYKAKRDERDLLYATLQLRLAIEETACASLVANRTSFDDGQRAFTLRKFEHVQKALKALNPDYWPNGIFEESPQGGIPTVWTDNPDALSGSEWMKMWGKLSERLHMRNPWEAHRDLSSDATFLRAVHSKLVRTLSSHIVTLVGGEHLVMARLWSTPVEVYIFTAVGPDPA
ncbi:hypothetical protein [Nesterenkonia sp. Act20]|uniref:hypothetical protein n=1 Tax=Nesterenkonia sp. Act20 TaxID=1483432 RepID=UPI001C4767A4|nr:hypothetical protein [Nesterenkonia sp. Act20]